jgi:hypothetical protein
LRIPIGSNGLRLGDELSPWLAGVVYNGVAGNKRAMAKLVDARILPDVLNRVQLRRARWRENRRDVFGNVKFACRMPSIAVGQQRDMCAFGDVTRYFIEMKLHGVRVGKAQRPCCAPGANRAKVRGVFVALVRGFGRPRSVFGPLPYEVVILADAHLILT